jgi:hypothetical protein
MPAPTFWFQGKATRGQRVSGLSNKEYLDLIKEEEAINQREAANVKLAPAINKGISDYAQEQGIVDEVTAQDPTAVSATIRQKQAQRPQSSSVFAMLDAMPSSTEDTSELEATLAGVGVQQPQPQQPPQQEGGSRYARLLKDVDPEIAKDLILEFRAGTMDAVTFYDKVKKARQTAADMRALNAKEDLASQRKIAEKAPELEKDITVEGMRGEASRDVAGIRGQAARDVAAMNNQAAAEREAKDRADAYNKRTNKLKTPDRKALNEIDLSIIDLEGIGNLFDKDFVGQVSGRVGSMKNLLGLLGSDEKTFRSKYEGFKNNLLKIRSGAAVTNNELTRIVKELPSLTDSPKQFVAAFNKQLTALKNAKWSYLNSLAKGGMDLEGWEADYEAMAPEIYAEEGAKEDTGTRTKTSSTVSPGGTVSTFDDLWDMATRGQQ